MRIILGILIALLVACASAPYDPEPQYLCPYPDRDIVAAGKLVDSVTVLPFAELVSQCDLGPVMGCVRGRRVFLLEGLSGDASYQVWMHEQCHLYEVYTLGKSWEETASHQGWTINWQSR